MKNLKINIEIIFTSTEDVDFPNVRVLMRDKKLRIPIAGGEFRRLLGNGYKPFHINILGDNEYDKINVDDVFIFNYQDTLISTYVSILSVTESDINCKSGDGTLTIPLNTFRRLLMTNNIKRVILSTDNKLCLKKPDNAMINLLLKLYSE